MKEKKSRFIRNCPLVLQLGIIFFAFMAIASFVNMVFVYEISMKELLNERKASFINLAEYTAGLMQNDRNVEWLFSYWNEHSEEMDIVYDDPTAVAEGYEKFLSMHPEVVPYLLDTETIKTFSAEDQKFFAELKYMDWLNTFNNLKKTYKPLFLSSFSMRENGDLFFYLNAAVEGRTRGRGSNDTYTLGTIHSGGNSNRPVREETWQTGKSLHKLEETNTNHYHVYAPINANGKTLCLIDITLEMETVKKSIYSEILRIEIFSILGFIFSAIVLFILLRAVVIKPVKNLHSVIKMYEDEKNAENVAKRLEPFFGKNEVGALSLEFSSLVSDAHNYIENIMRLTSEKERIGTELAIATTIQTSILPQEFPAFPERKEFDIYANMKPAKEVGGDFYDFFMIDDDHIALVIADVSGKGIPAALYMMVSKTVIQAQLKSGNDIEKALTIINNTLSCNNDAEMFVSAWIGIYEISTGIMKCANAGHEYPAIKRADGKFELFKDKHGFVLGGMPGVKYHEYEIKLSKGDAIFVYTDGVPEATNADNELWGTDRMIDALNNKSASVEDTPESMIIRTKISIDNFVKDAAQFDDITMLAFLVNS